MRIRLALLTLVIQPGRDRTVECLRNWLSMGLDAATAVYKIYQLPSTLIDIAGEELENAISHKARIAQSRYFFGDTFASRFDEHLKASNDEGRLLPSGVEVLDSIPYVKEYMDAGFDKAVAISHGFKAKALSYVLPEKLANLIASALTGERFLSFTKRIGPLLAFWYLDPSGVSQIMASTLYFAWTYRDLIRAATRETFYTLRTLSRGQLHEHALAMIHPKVESRVLDEFLSLHGTQLARDDKFPKNFLSKIQTELPFSRFLDYYEVFVKHFPKKLYGKGAIIPLGKAWRLRKPPDLVSRLAGMVGLFRGKDYKRSFADLMYSLLTLVHRHPINDGTFLAAEYHLSILGVPQQLEDRDSVRISSFDDRCSLMALAFISTPRLLRYVIMQGFYALTALAVRYPPPGTLRSDLRGDQLVDFAMRHGTPQSLLAVLQFSWPPPTTYQLQRVPQASSHNRVHNLVLHAFMAVRHSRIRPIQPCHKQLFNYKGALSCHAKIPVKLDFLRQFPDLSAHEIRYTALTIASVMFGVPVHQALDIEGDDFPSVELTVNAMLARRCKFTQDSLYQLVAEDGSEPEHQCNPLNPDRRRRPFTCAPSTLRYPTPG